jgi:ABC-type glycerol-3-phosphate transport system substrate-binding protein
MPRKAVALYFFLALVGAAIFVYFTFPRTRDEIPHSENQRPFPSSPGPNGIPVPENVPAPNTPKPVVPGPNLRVMAWANGDEAHALQAQLDAFASATGMQPVLTVAPDAATYRRDLQTALTSDTPPDVCLVEARDFSGLDPAHELVPLTPPDGLARRSVTAFVIDGKVRAVPDEFSVDLLFYHPHDFDRGGLAWPGRHWTWDMLEAMARALASLQLKDNAGAPIYPLELPANFDFWNILCTQAGHPALDRDTWHLADADGRDSRMRGLDLIHQFFHELSVTAPITDDAAPGRYFSQGRASLLIAPSELAATLPKDSFGVTLLPADLCRASLARVDGWAVTTRSIRPDAARSLAEFLARNPIHNGWSSAQVPPENADEDVAVHYDALDQALLPRVVPRTARLAQLLDEQIALFAREDEPATSANLDERIESEYLAGYASDAERHAADHSATVAPRGSTPGLRGL